MTTLTTLGPNSAIIKYSSESNVVVSNAIRNWLIEHGWTLHDQVSTSVFVLKAPNLDGVTYKYVKIQVNDSIFITAYESWSGTTGTNSVVPAGDSKSATQLYVQTLNSTRSGTVYMFATERYLLFYSIISNGNGGANAMTAYQLSPLGVFEFTREQSWDTAAYGLPCHVEFDFASGAGAAVAVDGFGGSKYQVINTFMPCRTSLGFIGRQASLYTRLSTPFGSWGYSYGTSAYVNKTNQKYMNGCALTIFTMPSGLSALGNTNQAFNIDIIENCTHSLTNAHTVRGKLCGVKLLRANIGSTLDTIPIKVNTTSLLADSSGETMDHIVFAAYLGSNIRYAIPL